MAKTQARKWTKGFFICLNFIVVFLFLLSCLTPWLSTDWFWWVGFCGLLSPYLIILLCLFILFWLIAKPKLSLIAIIALAIGYKQIQVVFAWNIVNNYTQEKQAQSIRIVDWNVQSFNGLTNNRAIKKRVKEDLVNCINNQQPDIVCLQEFNSANGEANHIALLQKSYPYYFFSKDYKRKNNYQSGCIIFSKFPFIDSGKIKYPTAESLIYVDVKKGDDTIRIFTTHLQSFKFKKADYDDIEKIKEQDDDALIASKNIFQKMKLAFIRRGKQVTIVKKALAASPYPSIICGDFNDVPNSYTYFQIKGANRQDPFLQKGFGIGRTFISLAFTLRIDYILPTKNFTIQQFEMIDEGLSDHIMLVTDLALSTH
jgi:endonuclease/exonuclease/phosphatase family metal-dependent hydrolase